MTLPHTLMPDERQIFDAKVNRLFGLNYAPLPGPNTAMDPAEFEGWLLYDDDRQINERYIESRYRINSVIFGVNYASFFHNVAIFSTTLALLNDAPLNLSIFFYFCLSLPFYLFILDISIFGIGRYLVRFNRQAQMVHRPVGGRRLERFRTGPVSVAWRDARPIIQRGSIPMLAGPDYTDTTEEGRLIFISLMCHHDVGGALASQRMEFLRRYMEKGLEPILPPPGDHPKIATLSAFNLKEMSHKSLPLLITYYLGFGAQIERWIEKKVNAFRWPEEIERLCAPDADLSGIDTTPIHPTQPYYYSYDWRKGFSYVEKTAPLQCH